MSPAFFDTHPVLFRAILAGVPGFEPGLSVLETDVLTVDTIPLRLYSIASLGLFVTCVSSATATELAEFQPVGSRLLILRRNVVSTLALVTLKYDIVAWHNFESCTWPLVFGLGLAKT